MRSRRARRGADTAFAINVNLFWTADPGAELAILRRALRPGGTLQIVYGAAGPTVAVRVVDAVSAALRAHGFTGVAVTTAAAGIAVTGRRSHGGGEQRGS